MKCLSLALAAALAAISLASAQTYHDSGGTVLSGVVAVGMSYGLASNINAPGTTSPVTGVLGASYVFGCVATTWNSATAQLQALGPDGATYINVGTAISANGTLGVVIGAGATVRVTVSGTPTGLYCNLS